MISTSWRSREQLDELVLDVGWNRHGVVARQADVGPASDLQRRRAMGHEPQDELAIVAGAAGTIGARRPDGPHAHDATGRRADARVARLPGAAPPRIPLGAGGAMANEALTAEQPIWALRRCGQSELVLDGGRVVSRARDLQDLQSR